jgi:hypothetical protein
VNEEKIAVLCKTKEQCYEVQKKAFDEGIGWWHAGKELKELNGNYPLYLFFGERANGSVLLTWSKETPKVEEGYTVTSAEEYLKGGIEERYSVWVSSPEEAEMVFKLSRVTKKYMQDPFDHYFYPDYVLVEDGSLCWGKHSTNYTFAEWMEKMISEGEMRQEKAKEQKGVLRDFLKDRFFGKPKPQGLDDRIFGEFKSLFVDSAIPISTNITTNFKGEKIMNNKTIEELFAENQSKDEKLMQKHFGREIQESFTGKLLLEQNKAAYLEEARSRENAEKEAGESDDE